MCLGIYSGLNGVPQPKIFVHVLTPEPVNVTIFGKKGLCGYNEVKDLEMRSPWGIQVGSYPGTSVLIRDRRDGSDTRRRVWEGRVKTEAETEVNAATGQGTPIDTRSWLRREGFSPGACGGNTARQTA